MVRHLSASEADHSHTSHSLVDSLCGGLEAELHKKVCSTVQKAISDTVCASLKRGIHEAVHQAAAQDSPEGAHGTTDTLTAGVCASIEEIAGNAVCAALKQVAADTVCKALKEAISARLHDVGRWDDDMPFHAAPEALNIPPEELLGNAVCAAMKQVFADTVCKALGRAIDEAVATVVQAREREGSTPLSEMMRAYVSVVEAGQLHLSKDGIWYVAEPNMAGELCTAIKERMISEVCSRLQQLATSALCARLKKAIRKEIRDHPDRCEQCKSAGRAAAQTAAHSIFTYKTGMMVMAVIAVAAIAIAAVMPNNPVHLGSSPTTTRLSLFAPVSSIADGSASLSGTLSTKDGTGLGDNVVELQRQANGRWTTLDWVRTLSDGSFAFELTRQNTAATSQATMTADARNQMDSRAGHVRVESAASVANSEHNPHNLALLREPSTSGVRYMFNANATNPTANPTFTVTISADPNHVKLHDHFTISGVLNEDPPNDKGQMAHLDLDEYVGGQTLNWIDEQSVAVGGHYEFHLTADAVGEHKYIVRGPATSGVVTVTVSPPESHPTITSSIDPAKVAVRQSFKIAGLLRDNGKGLTDTIYLERSTGERLSSAVSSDDGSYTFVWSESAAGTYQYRIIPDKLGIASNMMSIIVSLSPAPSPNNSDTSTVSPIVNVNPAQPSKEDIPVGHEVTTIPSDSSPTLGGHNYRVVYEGSADQAACTSEPVLINDYSSTLTAASGVAGSVNAPTSTLRFL